MMYNKQHRIEVMNFLAKKMDNIIAEFLKKIDTNWQPSDFLPDTSAENFSSELKDLQEQCKELPYDYRRSTSNIRKLVTGCGRYHQK